MLAYGKNMPRNNQLSIFCPEFIKICPEKNLPKIKTFLSKFKKLPTESSPPSNRAAVTYLSSRQQTPQTKETATGQRSDLAKGEQAFVIATNLKGKMYKPVVTTHKRSYGKVMFYTCP